MNFVDRFLEYTEEAESPTSYFRWAAYTTLAAVLRRNAWIDLGIAKIYPNMYTLILSRRSSLVKKSTPLKTSLNLLQKVGNTKIINGRCTVAGIINVMNSIYRDKNGHELTDGTLTLYSEEISGLFVDEEYAIDILTEWYDGHESWQNALSMGAVSAQNVCVTMLASSNEELLRKVYNSRATQGGLLARTFLIMEDRKRKKNSLMYVTPQSEMSYELVDHLRDVAKLKGAFYITNDARKFYHDWYNNFDPIDENMSTTGIEGRIHTHVLKLAMVKAVAEYKPRMEIQQWHMEEAIRECLDLMPNYRILSGITGGGGILEGPGRAIILLLLESDGYTRPKEYILWQVWSTGSETFDKIIETLNEAGVIHCYTNHEDKQMWIKLTDKFLEKYSK